MPFFYLIIYIFWKISRRRRYFALFFAGGEDEKIVRHHVGDCGPWPPQHRGKRSTCGLAGAAIVPVRKEKQVASMTSSSTPSATIAKLEGSLTGKHQLLVYSVHHHKSFVQQEV